MVLSLSFYALRAWDLTRSRCFIKVSAGNMQGQRRKNTTTGRYDGQGVEIFSPLWSKIAVYVPLHIPGRYITFAA